MISKLPLTIHFWKMRISFFLVFLISSLYSFGQGGVREFKKFYYPNGVLSSEGYFKNGKPDGFWKTYYVNGVIKSEGLWRNSVLDSTWKFFDNLGNVKSIINYYLGKKSGYYFTYQMVNGSGSNKPILISKELYLNDRHEDYGFYYYSNGSINRITHYVSGKKDGVEKEFDKDSCVTTLCEFSNGRLLYYEEVNRTDSFGKPYGVWKTFFDNGRIKDEKVYINGLLNGYVKIYNQKGALVNAILYRNDSIVRDSISNDELILKELVDSVKGITERGTFLGKIRVGNHYFSSTGKLDSCLVYSSLGLLESSGPVDTNGYKSGHWREFYEGTKLVKASGAYLLSQRVGRWKYFYRDGRVEQSGTFAKGKVSGSWEWFNDDGSLRKFEEYYNGLRDGLYYELDEKSDTLVVGSYISGLKDGKWRITQGDLVETGRFVSDAKDGEWKYYYANGKICFRGSYNQGIADGRHLFFYPNGILQEEQFYSSGYPVGLWKKYSEDGFVIITIQYKAGEVFKINGFRVED
ncbi:MAG TPA: hypothetical protein VMW01_10080 [Williamwhitmania sp.]|nr:hypothetical protein [Williamwhitmania sp.]